MRITLNHSQAEGMFNLITYLLTNNPYKDRAEKIQDLLVSEVRLKLRNKLEARSQKGGYSITISEIQALALEEWLILQTPFLEPKNFGYEVNEATKITNQINNTYG